MKLCSLYLMLILAKNHLQGEKPCSLTQLYNQSVSVVPANPKEWVRILCRRSRHVKFGSSEKNIKVSRLSVVQLVLRKPFTYCHYLMNMLSVASMCGISHCRCWAEKTWSDKDLKTEVLIFSGTGSDIIILTLNGVIRFLLISAILLLPTSICYASLLLYPKPQNKRWQYLLILHKIVIWLENYLKKYFGLQHWISWTFLLINRLVVWSIKCKCKMFCQQPIQQVKLNSVGSMFTQRHIYHEMTEICQPSETVSKLFPYL